MKQCRSAQCGPDGHSVSIDTICVDSGLGVRDEDSRARARGCQSHVFWQAIEPRHRTREFIAEPHPGGGMGIGLVYVPARTGGEDRFSP